MATAAVDVADPPPDRAQTPAVTAVGMVSVAADSRLLPVSRIHGPAAVAKAGDAGKTDAVAVMKIGTAAVTKVGIAVQARTAVVGATTSSPDAERADSRKPPQIARAAGAPAATDVAVATADSAETSNALRASRPNPIQQMVPLRVSRIPRPDRTHTRRTRPNRTRPNRTWRNQ